MSDGMCRWKLGDVHPTGRAPQARWCQEHDDLIETLRKRAYCTSPRGREVKKLYAASPKRKISRAAYDDAHPERLKVYAARYRKKHSTIGTFIKCAHPDCNDGFLRTERNGAQRYCAADALESRRMSNTESNHRYWRRKKLEEKPRSLRRAA